MFFHIVKKGDSISKIAKQYHICEKKIIDDNDLEDPYKLVVGECLIIKKDTCVYKVKKDDTLQSISEKFFIPIDKLIDDNNLSSNNIKEGQKLIINHQNREKYSCFVNGYCYPSISSETLKNISPSINILSPFSYTIKKNNTLNNLNDNNILSSKQTFSFKNMMVVTNAKEEGGFSSDIASRILNAYTAQDDLINSIREVMSKKKYDYLCIDFEYIYENEKELYTKFLQKIKNDLKEYPLFVALAPKISDSQKGILYTAHDYYAIGSIADYVILMTYEWGYTYGEPNAVAPLNEVRKVIKYAKSKIDNNKIIMGIPNYGYDWKLPYEKGNKATSISNKKAMAIAKEHNSEIKFDNKSQTPYFKYNDKEGITHIVHFDNACSLNEKINLMIDESLSGISIWTVTTYFSQLYLLIDYYLNIKD